MKTIIDNETGELIEVEEKNDLVAKEMQPLITDDYIEKLHEFQALKEQIEIYEFQQKEKIKEIFKKYGVKSFKNDYLTITYVEEHLTKKVDTDRLKEDGIYEQYLKFVPTKESIRISTKGKND